jgi:hypothetical protein
MGIISAPMSPGILDPWNIIIIVWHSGFLDLYFYCLEMWLLGMALLSLCIVTP